MGSVELQENKGDSEGQKGQTAAASGEGPLEARRKRVVRDNKKREGCPPRATMQKHEKKEVAGGASWKWLKIKRQICKEERKQRKSESLTASDRQKIMQDTITVFTFCLLILQ